MFLKQTSNSLPLSPCPLSPGKGDFTGATAPRPCRGLRPKARTLWLLAKSFARCKTNKASNARHPIFKNYIGLSTVWSHSKSCGFHIVAKLKHRNGEMRAAVILKRTKQNFWFLFLTFITAGNESQAKLNQIERRIWCGTLPHRTPSKNVPPAPFLRIKSNNL